MHIRAMLIWDKMASNYEPIKEHLSSLIERAATTAGCCLIELPKLHANKQNVHKAKWRQIASCRKLSL